MRCDAVVPAAGVSRRYESDVPKQYTLLAGKPMIWHTVTRLCDCPWLETVTVCHHVEDKQIHTIEWPDKVRLVVGADTRAGSVLSGLQSLPQHDNHWVFVHDAARPCITRSDLEKLYAFIQQKQAGVLLARPATNTLKKVVQGKVEKTIVRSDVWEAQTPQVFQKTPLIEAISACLDQGEEITDESSAMEKAGSYPYILEGEKTNIKVTYAEDAWLAQRYLENDSKL